MTDDAKVFISYRREETSGHAGRIYDEMAERYGDPNVFMDVDMKPGVDFVTRITEAVGACHVLLVIMGPHWATATRGNGAPRIAEPGDFVRLEVATALRREDVTVIPVLVAGARMPDPSVLPEDLQPLARRNAIEMSDTRWRYDMQRLVEALNDVLAGTSAVRLRPEPPPPPPPPARDATAPRPGPLIAGTMAVAALAGLVGRGIAEQLRPDSFATTTARIADVIVWRGIAWAVIGAAVALWLTLRLRRRASPFGRFVLGGLTGFVAGAGGAAIFALPRYLPDTKPAEDTLNLLSVLEFGFTGALVGALVGWIWSRRGSLGLLAGLVAGMLVELFTIAVGWEVNSASERVVKVGLDAALIVGFVTAAFAILDARQSAATATSASPRVA